MEEQINEFFQMNLKAFDLVNSNLVTILESSKSSEKNNECYKRKSFKNILKKVYKSLFINLNENENKSSYDDQGEAAVNILNDDCLIHIFQYLPIADRVRIERVCKKWQILSQASWCMFKNLDFFYTTWGVTRFNNDITILEKVLKRCGRFLNIIKLSLPDSKEIKALTDYCTNITELSLNPCSVGCDDDLKDLFLKNKKLRCLNIECNINGQCLLSLPIKYIESITLEYCNNIELNYLSESLPKFQKLSTFKCKFIEIDEKTAEAIGSCLNLKTLTIASSSIHSIKYITQLTNLQEINLNDNSSVTDLFLKILTENCKQISVVNISRCCKITDVGLTAVTSLPNLKYLYVNHVWTITDHPLGCMQNLKVLECRNCNRIQNKGLCTLLEISPNVELIDFSGCKHITNVLVNVAIKATKIRKNNITLTLYTELSSVFTQNIINNSEFLRVLVKSPNYTYSDDLYD